MTHRLLNHARHNVVGYIALMVAVVSGGGGYAVAATAHHGTSKHKKKPTTVVACASNKSGEMYLHPKGRCAHGHHKVTWAIKGPKGSNGKTGAAGATGATGPQGPAGPSAAAFGTVGPTVADALSGMTAQHQGLGSWLVTITNPTCAQTRNVLSVTPTDYFLNPSGGAPPANSVPVAWGSGGPGTQFNVTTGFLANGVFTRADDQLQIVVECGAAAVPGQ